MIIRQFAKLLRSSKVNNKAGDTKIPALINESSSSSSSSINNIIGGDFAGLSATFDPQDGSFIPVPERLVPDELLQWGQAPKTLQVLVSEAIITTKEENDDDDDDDDSQIILNRNTITVLPDIGCAIDNLGTSLSEETIPILSSSLNYWEKHKIAAVQYATTTTTDNGYDDENLRVETIFGMDGDEELFRMRVVMNLIPGSDGNSHGNGEEGKTPASLEISKPLVLSLERRANPNSSSGKLADGGLDGRTVSEMLGPELRKSKTFVDDDNNVLQTSSSSSSGQLLRDDGMKHVDFPGKVSIAYGWKEADDNDDENNNNNKHNEWVLEVCHGHKKTQRIVSRHFKIVDENKIDFRIDTRIEQDINDKE